MVTQNGIKLAVNLITTYFGDIVSKVCECLLRRGTLTLELIVQFTELKRESVKNALLVLIQQNCVQAFAMQEEGGLGKAPKIITQYMVLFDNIIHHMRFPKFLEIVSKDLGKECEAILEGLLEHGRLSLNQISDRYKNYSHIDEENIAAHDALKENFNRLVSARYVERCPAHEPFLEPPSEEENAVKKRGAKSKAAEAIKTIEEQALAAAAPMEAIRFSLEILADTDDVEQQSDIKPLNMTVGEKRKRGNFESDTEAGSEKGKKEVLWRANFEEFVRLLRHKACIINVKTRLGDGAGVVLCAMLRATRRTETRVKMESSVPASMNTIFEEVIKSEEGRGMTLEHVSASLVQLGCDLPVTGIDETYSIDEVSFMFQLTHLSYTDLKNIIDLAQNEEVESIVLNKYGRESYRIFRLLSNAGRLLETDKISDTTFVEKKDTAKILYKLWKDDYLYMEKINVHGGRQTEFSLWKVNKKSLWEHVSDDMYHAALNLRLRLAYEQEQEKEILRIPKQKLAGELEERVRRLTKVRLVLGSALMKLDDAIMLFHDF